MRNTFMLIAVIAATHRLVESVYQCNTSYEPSEHKGHTLVPSTCMQQTQLDCPRTWKLGVPLGKSTRLPLIDTSFITCHEGFSTCGYVPIDSSTGEVRRESGVTVGAGVDLGIKNSSSLFAINVPSSIVSKLEPYFGLRKNDAACAAIELPLNVTEEDAEILTVAVMNDIVSQVQQRYDQDRKSDTVQFTSLPRGIRTAISDVWFVFGAPDEYPTFWTHVTENNWENAIKELRDFYGPGASSTQEERRRRDNEADIIDATLGFCNRSIDLVFLVDESKSVSDNEFKQSLVFVENIIDSFPDEVIADTELGTRFGLSTFDSSYRSKFHLFDYTNKSQYFAALRNINQNRGSMHTSLGSALLQVGSDQFVVGRGLRDASLGLPRILIVVTAGQSSDAVEEPAENMTANNVVVCAIGIRGYDINQLAAVASTPEHSVPLSSFSELKDFTATLTAMACHEPQPISFHKDVNGKVKGTETQYYTYNVNLDDHLIVKIRDKRGSTFVYASRDKLHPSSNNHDFGFSSAAQADKEIVIAPSSEQTDPQETTSYIFISVVGAPSGASYTMVGSTCDPTECGEGAYGSRSRASMLQLCMLLLTVACGVAIGENLLQTTL